MNFEKLADVTIPVMTCDELHVQLHHSITGLANILSHTVIDLIDFLSMINMRVTCNNNFSFIFFIFHSVHLF